MAKIRYPEGRQSRDRLRDALKRRGCTSVDDIAQAIREQWGYGHIRSYRLALELGQPQVCDRVNALQGTFEGDPGYFCHQTLSKIERWPVHPRRPTVGQLHALAQVFGTSPRTLIADVDWDRFPPGDRLALDALGVTPVAPASSHGIMESARPAAGSASQSWWVAPEPIGSGNPIERAVTMANDESARYADRAGNVGPAILDSLREDTAELSGKFATASRSLELFASVRMLRDRIFGYLNGGQSMQQRRDLYFLAAVACGLLAVASEDLGSPAAGMSQARIGHLFAMEAGDPALIGWLYAVQSINCYWNGQPAKSREYARRGAALQPAGTVGVWLPAMEARAAGAIGDAEAARSAVQRATEVRDTVQPGTLDSFGGFLHYPQAKQFFYAADAFLGVGDSQAALAQATAAVETYQSGPVADYNHTDVAHAHFNSAIAHVGTNDLDAAAETARTAFQVSADYRSANVDKSAKRLHRQLRSAAVRDAPLAIETRDQIEDFLATPSARLELP